MVDPQNMPTAMVQAWAEHWQESLDENSTLASDARLNFWGQTVHSNPPPLPTADDAGTEAEPEASQAKGKSKARTTKSAQAPAAASAWASAAAPARRPRCSGLDVVVEIVPPDDFDCSAYQYASKIGPPRCKKKQPGLPSTLAASSVPKGQPALAGAVSAAASPISTEPGSRVCSQSPTARDIDEGLETGPSPEPAVQLFTMVASSVIPPPTLVNPSGLVTTSNQAQAATPSTPPPPRCVRSVPPVGRLGGALVEYLSDPESPLKAVSQHSNLRSLTSFVLPPGIVPQLPTTASLSDAVPPVNAILPPPASNEPTTATATNTAATPSTPPGPTSGTTASPLSPLALVVASDPPNKPPSYLRPHPKLVGRSSAVQEEGNALSVGRSTREAPILLKEMVSYELSKGKERKTIEERLTFWKTANPWTMDSFPKFMRTAGAAMPFAIKHSDPALGTLALLLQGALVTAWYSVAESPIEGQTLKKNRFKLLLPWHNLAAGSPVDFLFELLLDPTKPLPLLSSLTSVDGGWSLLDLGRFMESLIFAVEVAFNNVAAAPVGILIHSRVDAVLIARAIAFLRLTRSLHTVDGYSGPSLQDIDKVADRVIIFVNAISMMRFITHRVLQTVPIACDDDAKKSALVRKLWERYISAFSAVAESVAAAAALGCTDFFSTGLPESLPPALVSVAQTAMRHPAWWYGLQDGKTFGPKPLTIQTRNNLIANGLGKCSPACSTTSAAAANEAVRPSKLPALPQIPESEDQLDPLAESEDVATWKRKRGTVAKPKKSKRARGEASSDLETPPAQGSSTGRPIRSTRKKTPSVS
ncbi:hypothetical protein FRC04_003503 [Tulasnella sp. 424]|nr:hypothetical protein FRC04_003503 [Tulasnella sp. 424]